MEDKRINWVDSYRGILIILMVVGHSTSMYNTYIYQFHMAAFFFLSGYIAHPEKNTFGKLLSNKFFTILLPLFTTTMFGFFILWLLSLGNFDVLVSSWAFPGWRQALISLFLYGDIYVDVLGATWFLIILFGICILNKLLSILVHNSVLGYLVVSIALYIAGYGMVRRGTPFPHFGMFSMDLVLIGHSIYALGYCAQRIGVFENIMRSKLLLRISFFISTMGLWIISNYLHITIDWPSRTFSHLILDMVSAVNGILFIFTVTLFLHRFVIIDKCVNYIGKNTMGILLFHFVFFKVMYLPFYWLDIITQKDIACIIPGRMSTLILEQQYWGVITIGSIVLSLMMWKLLIQSRFLSFLLGQNKKSYAAIWNMLTQTKMIHSVSIKLDDFLKKIDKIWPVSNRYRWIFLLPFLLIIVLLNNPTIGSNLQECMKQYGYYEDGWIGKSSQFMVKTNKNGRIDFEIYCPLDHFSDQKLDVFVDNILVDTVEIKEAFQSFSVSASPNRIVQIRLEANFIQTNTGADERELSVILLLMEGK